MIEEIIKNNPEPKQPGGIDFRQENFDAKLLEKIKAGKISPKPRWEFLLKNYIVWAVGLLALLVGAAAISVMIYLFQYNDWNLYELTNKSFAEFFLLTLPYFWFIFLALFVFAVYYNFKHTKSGYRYSIYVVIIGSVSLSIILGSSFYALGLGGKIDNILGRQAPFYDRFINRHLDFWFNPDEGRLVGLVASPLENNYFVLVDRSSGEWIVTYQSTDDEHFIIPGQPVRMTGKETGNHEFRADHLWLLIPAHGFFDRFDARVRPHPPLPGSPRPPRF